MPDADGFSTRAERREYRAKVAKAGARAMLAAALLPLFRAIDAIDSHSEGDGDLCQNEMFCNGPKEAKLIYDEAMADAMYAYAVEIACPVRSALVWRFLTEAGGGELAGQAERDCYDAGSNLHGYDDKQD